MWRFLFRLFARLFGRSSRIEKKIDRVLFLLETSIMTKFSSVEEFTAAVDSATNAIAAEVAKLRTELADARATGAPPKPETLTALGAIFDRLTALGADPADPIPSATPAPAPVAPVVAPAPVPAADPTHTP